LPISGTLAGIFGAAGGGAPDQSSFASFHAPPSLTIFAHPVDFFPVAFFVPSSEIRKPSW
jgi:hypothetical protein